MIRYFPMRHHSPMCAKALQAALYDWQPDFICLEASPEASSLMKDLKISDLQPPVAILAFQPQSMNCAHFLPFTEYSPEWIAMKFIHHHQTAYDFIDLSQKHSLALAQLTDDQWNVLIEQIKQYTTQAHTKVKKKKANTDAVIEDLFAHLSLDTVNDTKTDSTTQLDSDTLAHILQDPLDFLAKLCGEMDAEVFWEHLVEAYPQSQRLFTALQQLFIDLRQSIPDEFYQQQDLKAYWKLQIREAQMRLCIHKAQRKYKKIAVICGAWHVSGLQEFDAKQLKIDRAILKILPKVKVGVSWSPWSDRRLSSLEGYSAGIPYPHWYRMIWMYPQAEERVTFTCTWLADQLRQIQYTINSADVIYACEMAWALAKVRQHITPGIKDILDSTWTLFTQGEDESYMLIQTILGIQNTGEVPSECLHHPLLKDFHQRCKSLRLKCKEEAVVIKLDLRQAFHQKKSQFLHKLLLLDIDWGQKQEQQNHSHHLKGNFHEVWELTWSHKHLLILMQACAWGETIDQAAKFYIQSCLQKEAYTLSQLQHLLTITLASHTFSITQEIIKSIQQQINHFFDPIAILQLCTTLINMLQYGLYEVHKNQSIREILFDLLQQLLPRLWLHLADYCRGISREIAQQLNESIHAFHQSISHWKQEELIVKWHQWIYENCWNIHSILSGRVIRFMLDHQDTWSTHIHPAIWYFRKAFLLPFTEVIEWLEGFLHQDVIYLMYQQDLLYLLSDHIAHLSDQDFLDIMPLLRRCFSHLNDYESQSLFDVLIHLHQSSKTQQQSTLYVDPQFYQRCLSLEHLHRDYLQMTVSDWSIRELDLNKF